MKTTALITSALAIVSGLFGGSVSLDAADPIRLTQDSGLDANPVWNPAGETIAFLTRRPPAGADDFNIGGVQADGQGEGFLATGPNDGFGLANSLAWAGSTGFLLVEERCVFHEYMAFDSTKARFTRTLTDGNDAAFTRKLLISGGGGGGLVRVSRDGSTVLWRFSSSGGTGQTSIRTAPYADLSAQAAGSFGTVHVNENVASPEQRYLVGAALTPDGRKFVLTRPVGKGFDLWLYTVDGSVAPVRLTHGGEAGEYRYQPDISPDGTTIACTWYAGVAGTFTDLMTMKLDGSNEVKLTQTPLWSEASPSWSPQGDRLAFARFDNAATGALRVGEAENWNIYVMDLPKPGLTFNLDNDVIVIGWPLDLPGVVLHWTPGLNLPFLPYTGNVETNLETQQRFISVSGPEDQRFFLLRQE